jgi:uncharacterized SAM-binding protein YcdF (DUF218 family)
MTVEGASRNTHESAASVGKLLKDDTSQKLLITSAFHMRRSKACFVKEGIEVDMFPVDFYTHRRRFTFDVLVIPKVDALLVWHKLIKEWVGMIAYKIAGYA